MAEVHVTGLADLQRLLDTLPAKLEANVMRGAFRSGIKPIEAAAKLKAPTALPSDSNARKYKLYAGALRDSIRSGVRIKDGIITGYVRAGGKTKSGADVFYAHMVEFGTAAHKIAGKNGGILFFGHNAVRSVQHPGSKAHAFMRPALDSQAQDAVIAIAEYMKKRLANKEGLDTAGIEIGAGS